MATAATALLTQENAIPEATPAPQHPLGGGGGEEVEMAAANEVGEESGVREEPSPTSPLLPLPANFMSALNMMPQPAQSNGGQEVKKEGANVEELVLGPGPKEELVEKFKKDPTGVLDLLQSALSMEKLAGLLKQEHRKNSQLLLQLQNRLEAAYYTLKECEEVKAELAHKISETNYKVGDKRKNLEGLRKELKILGDEEQKLKRRRDFSHGRYYKLKKQLNSSVAALEQIEVLSKSFYPVEENDLPEQEREMTDETYGEMNGETNGEMNGELLANLTPNGDVALDEDSKESVQTFTPLHEGLAPSGEGVGPSSEGVALSSEGLASAGGLVSSGERLVLSGEDLASTGEGSVPTLAAEVTGEGLPPTDGERFAPHVNMVDERGVVPAGESTGLAGGTGSVGGSMNLTPTIDDEILPFIGTEEMSLLDQDNFPLPQVENEGEGIGSSMDTGAQGNQLSLEMDDQVSALMREATPSDNNALPFSDLAFAESILGDMGNQH